MSKLVPTFEQLEQLFYALFFFGMIIGFFLYLLAFATIIFKELS